MNLYCTLDNSATVAAYSFRTIMNSTFTFSKGNKYDFKKLIINKK